MNDHPIKTGVDIAAGVTAIGTIAKVLPSIAALFTILWYAVRLWETDTVKKLTGRL